jgi:hypothetical protein
VDNGLICLRKIGLSPHFGLFRQSLSHQAEPVKKLGQREACGK